MAENRVIGRLGGLPWRLPADMERFSRLTTGHTVIMGRRTYESLDGPLSDRRNVVVTRNPDYRRGGITVVRSLTEALCIAADGSEVFVAGGGEIYAEALPLADRLYITVVHVSAEGDAYFPAWEADDWTLIEDQRHDPDKRHSYAFSFRLYHRRNP